MANPSGIQNGTKGLLYRDGVLVCGATSNGSSVSRVLVESTNKCSEEFRTIIPNSGTVTFDHSLEAFWSDDLGFDAVVGDWNSGAKVSFTFVYGDSGKEDSFVAVVESISNGYEKDTPVSSTISLKSSGSFTVDSINGPAPRQDFYYNFGENDDSYVELGRRIIPDTRTDDFVIEFNTGSVVPTVADIIVAQGDQPAVGSNDLLVYFTNSGLNLEVVVAGSQQTITGDTSLDANTHYRIEFDGSNINVIKNGGAPVTRTLTRSTYQSTANTFIAARYRVDTGGYLNHYSGKLYNVKIEPLNASSFSPINFYIDDNSQTLVDQNGGASATIQNYISGAWKVTA